VPIVATPVNGIIRSLVGDGEAGAIVNGSAGELGQALVRLTGDPQRRTRMSQAARCNSCGFTWERSVEATLGEYGVLLKTAAGAG
jgi:glycosyltransferase involved in cell wall biosynthesis